MRRKVVPRAANTETVSVGVRASPMRSLASSANAAIGHRRTAQFAPARSAGPLFFGADAHTEVRFTGRVGPITPPPFASAWIVA
jgi:hypothetical protein